MGLDLRTGSVWQGSGAISQWFGTAGRIPFSQMRFLGFVLGLGFFGGVFVF